MNPALENLKIHNSYLFDLCYILTSYVAISLIFVITFKLNNVLNAYNYYILELTYQQEKEKILLRL
ncbi:Uncharacterised protein [Orientia tsutsugamushi]|uniref:Uncharacterized protein n=1 Tax=Orientia tsutsugamushi str. TA716 TaxID=1359175 RepID=A0A0F3P4V7_ORITS|nr:hypothetical protein OTSTA763_1140 [Orientia tsutsugamushi str. TA763]KJV75365.1 hypothetical protein OTSTA716_1073 [Orientia tsutsugamushi str. TA716]SPP24708.1 Uncharacterised protein [Orientia tsutsugamushi]SPR12990.1 Uncharacterised protein [Orientia tsutsugamushi]